MFVGGVFWDGRATGERLGDPTAEQALGPPLNPVEQNMPDAQAVCDHVAASRYASLFDEAWGPGALDCSTAGIAATYDRIGLSIAAYEASSEVNSFSSRFDRYWRACMTAAGARGLGRKRICGLGTGDKGTLDPGGILTEQEFVGLDRIRRILLEPATSATRRARMACRRCLPTTPSTTSACRRTRRTRFTGCLRQSTRTARTGWTWAWAGSSRSRSEWAAMAEENDGKHRVPTIRNVDARPGKGFPKAYMHNGALKSLKEVVHFYNTRDVPGENWPPPEVASNVNERATRTASRSANFELSEAEEDAIVAFMKTLTDEEVAKPPTGFTGK